MASSELHEVPNRVQGAIYAMAFFSGNSFHMTSVILPLWALMLGGSPFMIGVFIGARQVLPVLLSIHGGAMMDRFGARRVILVIGVINAVTLFLFPAMPWMGAAIVIQLLGGLAESLNWIGVQTMVGQIMRGHPVYTGRMMFIMRIGGFVGPPLIGLAWDVLGPWGAFTALTLWIALGWVAAWLIPASGDVGAVSTPTRRLKLTDALPRLSDYVDAFRLLAIPAAALVIAATVVRQSGSGVQASFYIIYLEQIGVSGVGIGALLGLSAAVSAAASLGLAPGLRFIKAHWLLMIMVAVSIVTIAITPLLGSFVLLAMVMAARGLSQGFNLPLLLTIGSNAVGPDSQGKMVALRITTNRLVSAAIPVIMGALAEFVGLEATFYIIGATGLVAIAMVSIAVSRSSTLRGDD